MSKTTEIVRIGIARARCQERAIAYQDMLLHILETISRTKTRALDAGELTQFLKRKVELADAEYRIQNRAFSNLQTQLQA